MAFEDFRLIWSFTASELRADMVCGCADVSGCVLGGGSVWVVVWVWLGVWVRVRWVGARVGI